MGAISLDQFKQHRKVGPIRVAWFDDHPGNVEELANRLRKRNFEVKVFGEREEIFQEVRSGLKAQPLRMPDLCITDLLIDKRKTKVGSRYSGLNVGKTIIGMYDAKMRTPARVGIASGWPELIDKAPKQRFCFEYVITDLVRSTNGLFGQFERKINKFAASLWIDYWCINYMDHVSVEGHSGIERLMMEKFLFGYVVRLEASSATVWLWNPKVLGSGRLYAVDREFLKSARVESVHQPFRIVSYVNQKYPNATTKVVEAVSESASFEFQKAWPEFDPSEFEGLGHGEA